MRRKAPRRALGRGVAVATVLLFLVGCEAQATATPTVGSQITEATDLECVTSFDCPFDRNCDDGRCQPAEGCE